MFTRRLALVALLAFPSASLARATDYYVNAQTGSNANSGTSPGDAWQTITYAVASVPAPPGGTIHIAAGLYDGPHGEQFPINLKNGIELMGDAGSQTTIVDGGGGTIFLGNSIGVAIRGLSLRNAFDGINVFVFPGNFGAITLEDVAMESSAASLGSFGVKLADTDHPTITGGGGSITLDRVTMKGFGRGGYASIETPNSDSPCSSRRSAFPHPNCIEFTDKTRP